MLSGSQATYRPGGLFVDFPLAACVSTTPETHLYTKPPDYPPPRESIFKPKHVPPGQNPFAALQPNAPAPGSTQASEQHAREFETNVILDQTGFAMSDAGETAAAPVELFGTLMAESELPGESGRAI